MSSPAPWTPALALFFFAGLCWLPVVWLQLRMRDIARASERDGIPLGRRYRSYARVVLVGCAGVRGSRVLVDGIEAGRLSMNGKLSL
jgi:uncharacterized membrane protein